MSLRTLEAAILKEARQVTGNKKLRQKDIMEWGTDDVKIEEGETHYFLPDLRINIAISRPGIDERGVVAVAGTCQY